MFRSLLYIISLAIVLPWSNAQQTCNLQAPVGIKDDASGNLQLTCKDLDCVSQLKKDKVQCASSFVASCEKGQWIGAIKKETNGYQVKCCTYPTLLKHRSTIVDKKTIGKGETFLGQLETVNGTNQTHRRYQWIVTNIKSESGSAGSYVIDITRLPCRVPLPSNSKTQIDTGGGAAVGGFLGGSVSQFTNGKNCFPADSIVQTSIGRKYMSELKAGDMVLSAGNGGTLSYQKVVFFGHRDPTFQAEFLHINTEHNAAIKLTAKHAIYRMRCDQDPWEYNFRSTNQLVLAADIKENDCLLVSREKGLAIEKVTSITREQRMGIYAPMTENGVIIVDNVVASCFVMSTDGDIHRHLIEKFRKFVHYLGYFFPTQSLTWIYDASYRVKVDIPPLLSLAINQMSNVLPEGFYTM